MHIYYLHDYLRGRLEKEGKRRRGKGMERKEQKTRRVEERKRRMVERGNIWNLKRSRG